MRRSERMGRYAVRRKRLLAGLARSKVSLAGAAVVAIYAGMALFAPWLAPYDPTARFQAPPGLHHPLPPLAKDVEGNVFLLGTDKFGRDILSRAMYGVRTLLGLGFGSAGLALVVGVLLGGVAGYLRGSWLDELIMRAVDVMLSFPTLILILAIVGAVGVGHIGGLPSMVLIIGITYSPRLARLARAMVLREMTEEYVLAARATGSPGLRILYREILPNALPAILVQTTLMTASAILAGASLSFLGLGIKPPLPSLGVMLSESRDYLLWGAWWYMLVPGGLISIAVLAFNLLGDGLRDLLDPRAPGAIP